ncbi:putative major facilitator superfamily transporter [Gordonia effusa NBRC 100432]|uniref:Putative major facilitator superfamily transporter n=1 Tax=Gordonia effusa NBRC 100432 TaxID=1077974 RepID=H0R2I1_9ACTN|nr:MFS transporter [Gordonia effusa]GAB19282.1 putative major facilitator superfamily transporter [Gordonia effusa NBRC 100432]
MTSARLSASTAPFWCVSAITALVLFASAAPSPIYPLYQQLWGFSSFTLTLIFAVYVIALLTMLLTVGSISDHVGRRPVLLAGISVLILAMVAFALADGVATLMVARVVQGIATGAILGALSATMLDLQPDEQTGAMANGAAPGVGLSSGVIVAGIFVEYVPDPRVIIYVLTGVALAAALVVVLWLPETSPRVGFDDRRHVVSTIAPRASVPSVVAPVFFAGVPVMLATWSLGGMQLSLGSSVVARILGITNHAAAGAALAVFFVVAAIAAVASSSMDPEPKRAVGLVALFVGVLTTLTGALSASTPVYLIGSGIAGIGFGTAFVAVVALLGAVTPADERGRVFAAVFVGSYLGFSIPAVVAGASTGHFGLRTTYIGYSIYVIALVVLAGISAALVARRARRTSLHRDDGDEIVEADEVIGVASVEAGVVSVCGSRDE